METFRFTRKEKKKMEPRLGMQIPREKNVMWKNDFDLEFEKIIFELPKRRNCVKSKISVHNSNCFYLVRVNFL